VRCDIFESLISRKGERHAQIPGHHPVHHRHLAGVVFLSPLSTGQTPAARAPRPAWEYTSVIIVRPARSNADFTSWPMVTPDGQVEELGMPISVPTKAAELGAEGWELFSITPISNNVGGDDLAGFTSQLMYWFKRPK
jgi:hypothetical protein